MTLGLVLVAASANARTTSPWKLVENTANAIQHSEVMTERVAATGEIEIAFSPDGPSEALVLKHIGAAKRSIRVLAYSFTAQPVAQALIDAKKSGVDVAVLVDYENNITADRSGKARAALSSLVNAGIPTRTISTYPIHHSKVVICDGLHVQTGSYNYSAAARKNSENVIVMWNNPALAKVYLKHWQDRWSRGDDFLTKY